jgi:hypothetical protein
MTDLDTALAGIADWPLVQAIAESTWLFPAFEALHVIAITLVVGSIAIVDLRLLGITSRRKPVTELAAEILPWTWGLFALAAMAGSVLFISNAESYFHNTAFRLKMLFMALSGINMLFFHVFTWRSVHLWDRDGPTLTGAKIAGGLSLTFWILVVVCGRWIGFTLNM